MANKKVKIRKIRENAILPESKNGNWYDTYVSGISVIPGGGYNREIDWTWAEKHMVTSGKVKFKPGDKVIVYLGFAIDLGTGYEALLIPRSSTFSKKGLILGNSIGLIDDTYCGNHDEWKGIFYSTGFGSITVGDRLLQMRVQKSNRIELVEVDDLSNPDRGGFGSTGK